MRTKSYLEIHLVPLVATSVRPSNRLKGADFSPLIPWLTATLRSLVATSTHFLFTRCKSVLVTSLRIEHPCIVVYSNRASMADQEEEHNQYQWVLRYVILPHCNGNWNSTWTGNLGNGFPNPFWNLHGDLTGELMVSCTVNLYVYKFQFPLQCERISIILIKFLLPVPVLFKLCLNRPWGWPTLRKTWK